MDEQSLIDLALAGNDRAFEELTRRHERHIFSLCERILQNREDAEDACVETFVRAYENLRNLRAQPSIGPWLRRTATNFCISTLRKRPAPQDLVLTEFIPSDPSLNPCEQVSVQDDARLLRQCMDRMSAEDRTILMLRYLEDRTPEEIAELIGCSRAVLKVRLHRARHRLKRLYDRITLRPTYARPAILTSTGGGQPHALPRI